NFRIGYATSPDGIHWTKRPGKAGSGSVLGLGTEVKNDFHGYGQPDYKGAGQPFVIKEGLTYRMWYEGFDGRVWRIFYAVSNDGVKWDAKGALLNGGSRGSLDELGLRNPVVIKRKGEYELWYQGRSGGLPNYHVLRATSPNGIGWTKIQGEVTLHPPSPVTKNEEIFVDSILVQPDGSCQVFYSKENTTISQASDGGINESKRFANYMEVVNP
ncbi:MAG: hypothetical protein Q7N50_00320, partial [Armatimonadota bacterium]|nr:hypothetical protein [Armatimonadota bacterium]